jgi:xanthine/uracil permease
MGMQHVVAMFGATVLAPLLLAVTGGNASRVPFALCGTAGAALLYLIAALITLRWGSRWIDRLMPPIVTGSVVALIGLNPASSALTDAINTNLTVDSAADLPGLIVAAATFFTAVPVPLHLVNESTRFCEAVIMS